MSRVKGFCLLLGVILSVGLVGSDLIEAAVSETALIQRKIFQPDVWHLTRGYTQSQWGVDLFHYPYSVSQAYFMVGDSLLNAVSFFSDRGFCRLIYSDAYGAWIRAYGGAGEGPGQFFYPSGIVVHNLPNDNVYNYYVFVADAQNNRIVSFVYNWPSETMAGVSQMTDSGFCLPSALDVNNGGAFGNSADDRLWVANGLHNIKKFDLSGNLLLTYDTGWLFNAYLTGIACGKSYFTSPSPPYEPFANNNDIYVIAGMKLMKFTEDPPGNIECQTERLFPSPMGWTLKLTSVDTDNFGHVWLTVSREQNATGYQESYIRKYTSDLDVICDFDAGGILNHPQCFSNTGGREGCGDCFLLEDWDDESGGYYYAIGTDLVNFYSDSYDEHWCHFADYTLVDPSLLWVNVYNESDVFVRTVFPPPPYEPDDSVAVFSGWERRHWDGTDDNGQIVPSGNYRIEVKAASTYFNINTNQPVNTVVKDGWVYHIDYTEPMNTPTATSVDAVDTCLCVYWDDNNSNELGYIIQRKDDTNPLWITLDTTTWDAESYTDYDVIGSETYYYRVQAYNYFSNTNHSNTLSKKARPFPPLNLFVENFYCNRDYRPIGKLLGAAEEGRNLKLADGECIPPYPDSIPSDASAIYADYPVRQKPGTFAGMEVWSRSCHWLNPFTVRHESTFVDLDRHMLVQTRPGASHCSDWTYFFKVKTIDIYGDSSICWPPGELGEVLTWVWPYACCVGTCHVNISQSTPLFLTEAPAAFSLAQNHPNPFNPETQITYALPEGSKVTLVIFNILGQRVRTLVDEQQDPGYKTVTWDGKDEKGHEVASGIYFYRLKAGDYGQVKKMVVLK